jgi:sulfite exporter TauE/SafE
MLNGFLPCPTTYAVLGWTLSLDSALKGAFSMAILGVATFPSFILMWYSLSFKKLWSGTALKKAFALVFLGLAILKLYQLITMPAMACCPNMGH